MKMSELYEAVKLYEWPTNIAYLAYGPAALEFNQDQKNGLLYLLDSRREIDKEMTYLFFEEGESPAEIGRKLNLNTNFVEGALKRNIRSLSFPGYRKFVFDGLTVALEKERVAEQEAQELEQHLESHPLERELRSWADRLGFSYPARNVIYSLEENEVKTLGDFVDYIALGSVRPYHKLQAMCPGQGEKAMREVVKKLQRVVDIPHYDIKQREQNSDKEKIINDYNKAKSLLMFDEDSILKALKNKYLVSLEFVCEVVNSKPEKDYIDWKRHSEILSCLNDAGQEELKKKLNVFVGDTGISERSLHCLVRAQLNTVDDIINRADFTAPQPFEYLLKVRSLGQKCYEDIVNAVWKVVEMNLGSEDKNLTMQQNGSLDTLMSAAKIIGESRKHSESFKSRSNISNNISDR